MKATKEEYLLNVLSNLERYESRVCLAGNMSESMQRYLTEKRKDTEKQLAQVREENQTISQMIKTAMYANTD